MPFSKQTNPVFSWERIRMPDQWDDDPCLITTYHTGDIARVEAVFRPSCCVFYVHYRDGSCSQWQNTIASVYNCQFGISVSKDGRFLFVQTWDKGLFCYDAKTGTQVWRTKRRFGITNIFVNESTVLVHQHDKALQLLDIKTGQVLKEKKPARAWGFYLLDEKHIICHTCAKHWEIIRAEELETVEVIPAKRFPDAPWCVRNVYLEAGNITYEAFHGEMKNGEYQVEVKNETIESHYQEET